MLHQQIEYTTEAALKGFVLPLNKGVPFDELSFMGIEDEEEIGNVFNLLIVVYTKYTNDF